MIEPNRWLAFLAASLLIGILPGPGVANIVGHALSSGRTTALAAIAGAVTGNVIAMLLSLAGVGMLVQASPHAFRFVALTGALYLVGLGLLGLFRSRPVVDAGEITRTAISPRVAFAGSVAVSAFNPKSIIFFLAFVPQFISPTGAYATQAAVLVVTFASVVAFTDAVYAFLALRIARVLRSPEAATWVRRAGGLVLLCTGLAAAALG